MIYYASKNGITKEIEKSSVESYEIDGWTITTSGEADYNPYDYSMVSEERRLAPVIIDGEEFDNYSSFMCVNTKTYVNSPERVNDGSIPDINEIATFSVPRFKIKFDYMSIEDFRRMLKAISGNEFTVIYYDSELGKKVSYQMYVEPREMATLYSIGYEILGVLGYEFSFIGTLNNLNEVKIEYYNGNILLQTVYEPYGNLHKIAKTTNLVYNGNSSNVSCDKWNTQSNGNGQTYLPQKVIQATQDLTLYAIWE